MTKTMLCERQTINDPQLFTVYVLAHATGKRLQLLRNTRHNTVSVAWPNRKC